MSSLISSSKLLALSLVSSALLVNGCSSSDSSSTPAPPVNEIIVPVDGNNPSTGNDNNTDGVGAIEPINNDGIDPTNSETGNPDFDPSEPGTGTIDNPSIADPLSQNLTQVNFDITVPAFMSDALQVRLIWGDIDFTAEWVGDEIWSATASFPSNAANTLEITFSDNNGGIPLARVEQSFSTSSNDLDILSVSASQFNSDLFDADNDGISNLDELLAGTDVFNTPRILLFSETRGFRHPSIPDALTALEQLATSEGYDIDRADDSVGVFTDENLAQYDAIIWALTSGDVLNDDEQAVFERYIRTGRGYAGIHAASDTEYEWPWYGELVGAYFERHPEIQSAVMNVEDGTHASTVHLDATWTRTDEWYDFRSNPRAQVNVLLTLEESSYIGGGMGSDHPIAWFHEFDGGRSWYTGGGHTSDSYSEPDFRSHLLGGIRYAVGRE